MQEPESTTIDEELCDLLDEEVDDERNRRVPPELQNQKEGALYTPGVQISAGFDLAMVVAAVFFCSLAIFAAYNTSRNYCEKHDRDALSRGNETRDAKVNGYSSSDDVALAEPSADKEEDPSASLTIERLRFDMASISIDMMKSDTASNTAESIFVDIGPFRDLIEAALDVVGIWGVIRDLLEVESFVVALTAAAEEKGIQGLSAEVVYKNKEPFVRYEGIRNDRKFYKSKINCNGCKWWLGHYVGAIIADVLLPNGSLPLGSSVDKRGEESIFDAPTFMEELHKMQRMDDADISSHHVGHGFTWQYVSIKMPELGAYPVELAQSLCGKLLWEDEYHSGLHKDIGRECRHGFGHAVFFALAQREIGGREVFPVRTQFLPCSGFHLCDKSMCEGNRIGSYAPNKKALQECYGAMNHSYRIVGDGTSFGNFGKKCPGSCWY